MRSLEDQRIVAALAATGVIWGLTFLLLAKGLYYFPPVVLQVVRYFIGFATSVMGLIVLCIRDKVFRSKCYDWVSGKRLFKTIKQMAIVASLFQGIGAYSCVLGETHVSSSIVSILFCLEPIFAALFLYVVGHLEESFFDPTMIKGIVASIVGVGLVLLPELMKTDPEVLLEQLGFIFVSIVAVAAFGVGAGVSKIFSDDNPTHPLLLISGQFFFGLVILGTTHILEDLFIDGKSFNVALSLEELEDVPFEGWAIVFLLGTVSTSFCWGLFTWLVGEIGAKASVYTFIVPCISLLAGAIFNNEWKGLPFKYILLELIGVVIVLIGMKMILHKEIYGEEGCAEKLDQSDVQLTDLKANKEETALLLKMENRSHRILVAEQN